MLSVTVLLSLLALTGVNAAPSLSISLSGTDVFIPKLPHIDRILGADNVKDVDNFSIVTTITNTGDETLKLYQDPRSALSSFPVGPIIHITAPYSHLFLRKILSLSLLTDARPNLLAQRSNITMAQQPISSP